LLFHVQARFRETCSQDGFVDGFKEARSQTLVNYEPAVDRGSSKFCKVLNLCFLAFAPTRKTAV
jgi:hypothetical protein